jgi:hypothetical protein
LKFSFSFFLNYKIHPLSKTLVTMSILVAGINDARHPG